MTIAELEEFKRKYPDVKTVECFIPDISGIARGKWLPISNIDKVFSHGLNLPVSIFGLDLWGNEVQETNLHVESGDKDGYCRAIANSLKPVPWLGGEFAQIVTYMTEDDGKPCMLDPRNILAELLDRLAEHGLHACVAFEMEFFLLPQAALRSPMLPGATSAFKLANQDMPRSYMYDLTKLHDNDKLLKAISNSAAVQDIPVDTIVAEGGEQQYEINLTHTHDPLSAVDNAILLRRLIRGCAENHDMLATFMAKPADILPGSGMHVHISLYDDNGKNAFGESENGGETLDMALGGLLATIPDFLAGFISTFNGYRRISPHTHAPAKISWGHNNRSVALRIPESSDKARRIEHRIAGADAHPAIVLAAIIGGILHGLDNRLSAGKPVTGNAHASDEPSFSTTMAKAIANWEQSAIVNNIFGSEFQHAFSAVKNGELNHFLNEITPLERESYL